MTPLGVVKRGRTLVRYSGVLLTVSALSALVGCAETTASGSPLLYRVSVLSHPIQTPIAGANPGDTVVIRITLEDSTSTAGTLVTIRPLCATVATILRGSTIVATVPAPATCPDSVYQQTVGRRPMFVSYGMVWAIPATLATGSYTIRAQLLVNPSQNASLTLPLF